MEDEVGPPKVMEVDPLGSDRAVGASIADEVVMVVREVELDIATAVEGEV